MTHKSFLTGIVLLLLVLISVPLHAQDNTASGESATVGGGTRNTASADYSTVGGGWSNTTASAYATVSGGWGNTASGIRATVSGGGYNTASGTRATIGGGSGNTASDGNATTVSGGMYNTASGSHATVGGGWSNTASGESATVGGGWSNVAAGDYSFVVGQRASNSDAEHDGVFLFADATGAEFYSAAANEFAVRASGGVRFVVGTTTCILNSGATDWSCGVSSSRDLKADFEAVDARHVLDTLASLPMATWSYDGTETRHIGPVAQDFHEAFGLGASDQTIEFVDANGVALAAIQGLYEMVQEKDAQIDVLHADLQQTRLLVMASIVLMLAFAGFTTRSKARTGGLLR